MPPKTEQEKFLEENQEMSPDIFAETPEPEKEEETPVVDEENLRNRRERRLNARLEAERLAGIQMAAQIKAKDDLLKLQKESDPDYLKNVERIYGTDSPEAQQATELLKSTLRGLEESATERAYSRLKEEQDRAREEERKAETELNSMLEEIEDEYKTDLTTNTQTRTAFLTLLEKMSPKDADGNIIAYADHHAVYEMYQSRTKKPENRAKDLASRTMNQGGASKESTLQNDSQARYLIENGFI